MKATFRSTFTSIFVLMFFSYTLTAAAYLMPSLLVNNFSPWETGALMSAFFVGAILARPFSSKTIEKFGIKRGIILSALGGMIASLAYLSSHFMPLLIARFLVGCSYSIMNVAVTAYQSFAISAEERGKVFGYLCIASMLPQFILVPLSEFLIDMGALRLFWLQTFFFLLLTILYTLHLRIVDKPSVQSEKDVVWGTWRELFSYRATWAMLTSMVILSVIASASVEYVPNLIRTLGLKGSLHTESLAMTSVLVRILFCAMMLTRYDRRTVFCFWTVFEAVSVIVSAKAGGTFGFICGGVLYGLSHGFSWPAMNALIADVIPPHLLPKGSALLLLCNDVPKFIFPLVLGIFSAKIGMDGVIGAVGILGLISMPLVYLFLWERPPLFPVVTKDGNPKTDN